LITQNRISKVSKTQEKRQETVDLVTVPQGGKMWQLAVIAVLRGAGKGVSNHIGQPSVWQKSVENIAKKASCCWQADQGSKWQLIADTKGLWSV
jgi:hypothetical protein